MRPITSLKKTIIRRICSFLAAETVSPPLVYFLLLAYLHVNNSDIGPYNCYLQASVGVTLILIANFNALYMIAPFIGIDNQLMSVVLFSLCCLASNQKWKSYLLFFAIGDALTRHSPANQQYLVLGSTLFLQQIYSGFIFKTIKDNQQYFSGFLCVAVYYSLQIIIRKLNTTLSIWFIIPVLIVSLFLGYAVMKHRICALRNQQINQIRNSRMMGFYLQLMEDDIKTLYVKKTKIQLHRIKCKKVICFCHQNDFHTNSSYYIRQLYEDAINFFRHRADPLLMEYYTHFLIKNQQIINALFYISNWKGNNYFGVVARIRCEQKISRLLKNQNSANTYEKEYHYALSYDDLLLELTISIHDILQQKVIFWSEVSMESPLMGKLQIKGALIIDKMYRLNQFYNSKIKKYQKKLYSFDATILYAMYLLSTTNFKEYAQIIIKNTSKLLEEVYVFQNSVAQIFSIRTKVENQKKSYFKDQEKYLQYGSKSQQSDQDRNYRLIIDSISRGFCRLIKVDKQQLMGSELSTIIPIGYKEVHEVRLKHLMNFQSKEIKEIVPSKVLHKELKLPIKGANGNLFIGFINIKIHQDLALGLTFISVIRRIKDRSNSALLTFEGQITEKEEGFLKEILQHSEVKKYMEVIKQLWYKDKVIAQQKFNLMINTANYCITINSPLLGLFLEKQNLLKVKNPPLHIEILNQDSNKQRNVQGGPANKIVKDLKKMQNALGNHDTESSGSAKGSTSAINILSSFSESNSVPVYRVILLIFVIVVLGCFSSNLVGFLTTKLSWDNTQANHNPINDTINFYKLQLYSVKLLSNIWDYDQYRKNKAHLDQTQIDSYFGLLGYQNELFKLFSIMQNDFRKQIYVNLQNMSSLLTEQIQNKWNIPISVTEYFMIPNDYTQPTQQMSFLSLMFNYAVDLNLLSKRIVNQKIMISTSYGNKVIQSQNATNFNSVIDSNIQSSRQTNLIISISMSIVILFTLIPLWYFLRSRLPIHQKIFDLIVSVESSMVMKQIHSLTYITNILKNYRQSSQILKSNVMDYQEHMIYPKSSDSAKGSVNNDIVLGLQKYDAMADQIGTASQRQNINDPNSPQQSLIKFGNTFRGLTVLKQKLQYMQSGQQRRRDGQLDFKGSQSDQSRKIIGRHMALYIVIVIFIVFIGTGSYLNDVYMSSVTDNKQQIFSIIDRHILDSLHFLLGKVYLRKGLAGLNAGDPNYGLLYLKSVVESLPTYNYSTQNGLQKIYPNCSLISNSSHLKFQKKLCEYNYSYLILVGQYSTVFKQLFEARSNADANQAYYNSHNQTQIYNSIIYNISQKIYYLQSLNHRLQEITFELVQVFYSKMVGMAVNNETTKLLMLILAVSWALVSLMMGMGIVLNMKKQYFKEIYMITFLNSDMILKNKRVESFLDTLSKSSNN